MEQYVTATLKNESLRILRDVGRRPLPHQQPLCPIRPKAVTKWTHSCCSAQREMLTLTLRRLRGAGELLEIGIPFGIRERRIHAPGRRSGRRNLRVRPKASKGRARCPLPSVL